MLVQLALQLLRLASEALFLFELNRTLGAVVHGGARARTRSAAAAELALLARAEAPTARSLVPLGDGTAVHTVSAGPLGGPVVVLLHGHSMCGALFFAQLGALARGGLRVLAPDLPGWGRSSRPRFRRGSGGGSGGGGACGGVAYYADRVELWLDAAGLRRFALVGHSLGAYLAHEIARRRPGSVRALCLAAPAAVAREVAYARALWFRFTPQRFLAHGGLLAAAVFGALYPAAECYNAAGVRDILLADNAAGSGAGDAAAAAMLQVHHAKREARVVRPLLELVVPFPFPVALLAGGRDALVPVENVQRLYARMQKAGVDVTLAVLPTADHSPHISAPEAFAAAIKTTVHAGAATATGKP